MTDALFRDLNTLASTLWTTGRRSQRGGRGLGWRRVAWLSLSSSLGAWLLGWGAAQAAPFAYLTTNTSTVKVLDLANNTTGDGVVAGPVGNGVAVNRQGTRVYLAGQPDRRLTVSDLQVIDAMTHTALTPIPLNGPSGRPWAGVAVNAAGDRVFVASPSGRYMAVVDPGNDQVPGRVVPTIPITGTPANLAFNPTGFACT